MWEQWKLVGIALVGVGTGCSILLFGHMKKRKQIVQLDKQVDRLQKDLLNLRLELECMRMENEKLKKLKLKQPPAERVCRISASHEDNYACHYEPHQRSSHYIPANPSQKNMYYPVIEETYYSSYNY